MTSPITVGFLSAQNYLDKNTFSGTLYYMYQALARRNDIHLIRLGKPQTPYPGYNKLSRVHKNNRFHLMEGDPHQANEAKPFVARIEAQLAKTPCDVIVAPVASKELYYLNLNTPVMYLSDVTFRLYETLYPLNLTPRTREFLEQTEVKAIASSQQQVYSSDWAAQSAIHDYHANPDRVHVVPFGANIDTVPAETALQQRSAANPCRLLFIGKDWQRKGGFIAYDAFLALLEQGLAVELTMLGSVPPKDQPIHHANLSIIPYLDKNIPKQRRQFEQLLLQSHFLLFPTRADCSPIAICEANAYGLPVVAAQVGGIPSLITPGQNGYTLPLEATGADYARLIADVVASPEHYHGLSQQARQEYDQRLNWDAWASRIRDLMVA
jgi:glycosyltransferase involved in cell wall biosynthesis